MAGSKPDLERFAGPFPVLPTPFDSSGAVDAKGLEGIIELLLDRGIGGLTILGSSSESTYLTKDERCKVMELALKRISGRAITLVGIIQWGSEEAVEEALRAKDTGADALMVALPQYYRTPLDEVIRHYEKIVSRSELPVFFYHYPEATGLELKPKRIRELFDKVDLVGIKESGFSTPEMTAHLKIIERPIKVFTGQSFNLLKALDMGAVGSICPVSVLMPATSLKLVEAVKAGDREGARKAQKRLFDAFPLVTPGNVPVQIARAAFKIALALGIKLPKPPGVPHAGIKEALAAIGIIDCGAVRSPQPPLNVKKIRMIKALAPELSEL